MIKCPTQSLLFKIDNTIRNNLFTTWFASYLSSRQQFVQIKDKQSRLAAVKFGVPRGSVLGHVLFLLFTNDLPHCVTIPIRLFADDCVVYSTTETQHDQVNLNDNLRKIGNWCKEWQMTLNAEKTIFMSITRKRTPLEYNYQIDDTRLQRAQKYKYLGILFTPDLRWNTHIDYVCSKVTKALSLRRNLYGVPPDNKCPAYKTLVKLYGTVTHSSTAIKQQRYRLGARFIVIGIYNKYRPLSFVEQRALLESLDIRSIIDQFNLNHSDCFQVNTPDVVIGQS